MKRLFLILIFTFSINTVFADSPLTSSVFYQAYLDMPIVQEAFKSKGKVTDEIWVFILDDMNPLHVKLAIINGIGWEHEGVMLSNMYLMHVMKVKNYQSYSDFKWGATSDELICYSYMLALDNYYNTTDAFEIAREALRKAPNSFAVNIIYNLIKSQGLTAYGEYCYASKLFLEIKCNTNIVMDMRIEALSYIFEYMISISENCKTNNFYK